jgi:hypothetical protein
MQDLIEAIRKRNVILFVGAGVSMNLGLPSWNELISYLAEELEYDVDIFKSLGDYLTLAEYYEIKKATIGSLRSWMDTKWHSNDIKIEESKIHKLIVDLNFPIIYTTNYDRWIERAFKYYSKPTVKIANVGDITKIQDNYTQIIKLHGDFDDDKSIVLTESSYFERLSFDSPIDIKLRSDILGKSILFIGYSLNDLNIRYLFYKLNKLWESSAHSFARPKSYIFLDRPNPIQEEVLRKRGILTFVSKEDDIGVGLEKFLSELVYDAFGDKV